MLTPPDVVTAVITRLMLLDDAVSDRAPNPLPDSYTRVSDGGGERRNLIQADARVIVECWASTNEGARARAARAWGWLCATEHSHMGDLFVSRVNAGLPVDFYDTDARRERYQFVAQVTAQLQEVPT